MMQQRLVIHVNDAALYTHYNAMFSYPGRINNTNKSPTQRDKSVGFFFDPVWLLYFEKFKPKFRQGHFHMTSTE